MRPIEFVNKYDNATQLKFGSGPMSALMKESTGAARPKPPTPHPKLAPMANTILGECQFFSTDQGLT